MHVKSGKEIRNIDMARGEHEEVLYALEGFDADAFIGFQQKDMVHIEN